MTARVDHVREDHGGTAEHIVFKLNSGVHRDIILNLYPIADLDPCGDDYVLTKIAVASNPRPSHYMTEVPYFSTKADFASAIDNRCWIGEILSCRFMNLN